MRDELAARRKEIEIRVQTSEADLRETRNSAALGGHSRAVLLHLERRVQAGKKDLALLDLQLTTFSTSASGSEA